MNKMICEQIFGTFLLIAMLIIWVPAVDAAGPSANRIKQGPGLLSEVSGSEPSQAQKSPAHTPVQAEQKRPASPADNLDGVWQEASGKVLLIKQIHNTLYLSGSSDLTVWQAQCVGSASRARCMGQGISKTAGEFQYESELHTQKGRLLIDWQHHYSNGSNDSGSDQATPF